MNKTLLEQIRTLLIQVTALRRRLIVHKAKQLLGTDFTPDNVVPDELACAQAVTTLLKWCGAMPYVITGTWTLWQYFARSKRFVPVAVPEPGDIAIAPTGTGKPNTIGHVWIVGENGIWYSNSSYTGKWSANYTQKIAEQAYTKEKGIKIYYFRYISII